MNKYQEDLNAVVEDVMKYYNGVESSRNKAQIRFENECEPMVGNLQYLVNKENAMKLVQESPGQPPTCDNCYNEYPSKDAHYCPNCGQKIDKKKNHLLDWSE